MLVIDASLVVQLLVVEQFSVQARQMASYWKAMGIILAAPDLIRGEVTSALYKKIPARIIFSDYAKEMLAEFYKMEIEFHSSSRYHHRAIDLALELRQRMPYDSHYLALAEALDCDFWTADRPFYRAARPRHPRVQWIGNA